MKIHALTFIFFFSALNVNSQVVDQVIGSSGMKTVTADFSFSFTVGEVAVANQETEPFAFREGFWFWNPGETGPAPLGLITEEPLLYPNPTSGALKILKTEGVKAFRVFNASGQLLLQQNIKDDQISLEALASGIYHVELLNSEEKPIHSQIIFKN